MAPPLPHRHARRPPPRLAEEDLCPDDEGSDQADGSCAQHNMRGGGGRPQHAEAAPPAVRATPHGAMTSILSAADYAPPPSAGRKELPLQSKEHADNEAPGRKKTNDEAAGEGAAKKALRLRASRHFHRGGAGGNSNTGGGKAGEAGETGSPNKTVASERASLSRAKLNAATAKLPKARGSPPRDKALPSPSSLEYYPRGGKGGPSRKDSPPTPQPPPQPEPQPTYEMASSKEDDPDLQVFSDLDAASTATSGYHSGSDLETAARRLLRGRGKRRYPSPQTLRGEDAELAKVRSESAEGTPESGRGDSAIAKNEEGKNGEGTNAVRPKATLPRGWRERIERKTGRRVPRMEASKRNETGISEEASKELGAPNDVSGSDRDFSSMPQPSCDSRYSENQHGADGQSLPFARQQSGQSAASSECDAYYHPEDLAHDGAFPSYRRRLPQVLEGGATHHPTGRSLGTQPYPPSRGSGPDFPLPYAPGTRPYRPPYPEDLEYPAGESGSLEEDEGSPLRTTRYEYRGALGAVEESPGAEYYSHEEWNPDDMAMGSTVGASWEESPGVANRRYSGGDGRGFSASTIDYNGGGDGYMNGGPPIRPIPITESGFPISSLDGPAYSVSKTSTKRVRFSASVDGGEGDDGQHSEGDDDEYFHRFYSKAAEDSACWDEVPAPQHEHSDLCTHWEPIPASPNVKWTTSASARGRRSSSLPPPATTQEDIDVFKWNGSDTGMASIPRWKAQKLFDLKESPPKAARQDASIRPIESRGVTRKNVESRGRSPARPVMYAFAGDDKLETKPKKSSQALHAFSDGDVSEDYTSAEGWSPRKSKRGLRSFLSRSRSGSRTRTYKSEGERSDNDWDSADDRSNFSFSLSPMRRGRKTKKKRGYTSSKSPRRMKLFGEKHHPTSDAEDTAPRVYTEIYVTGEVGKKGTDSITTPITSNQTEDISSVQAIAGQIKQKKRSPKSKAKPSLAPLRETKVQESMEAQPTPPTLSRIEEPAIVAKLNASMETQKDTDLNDSRETQETPLVSNAKMNGRAMQQRANTNRPPLPPRHDVKIEASASDDSPHSGTTIRTEDDGSVSTLGSLVTRDNSEAKPKKTTGQSSDMSTVTELSEIERLRKENDRLREELENASNLSSRVSSMYAESLKRENVRLREELDHTPELSNRKAEDAVHKSTLEMLLENDNKKRTKKKTRRRRPPRKRNDTLTSFDHLPPVAHMINGDFDDDSTTINSIQQRRRGRRDADCDTGTEFIKKGCSRVATTARTLAIEAIELNNERRATGSSCTVPVPACFTACARRNRNGSVTTEVTHKRSNSWRKVAHKVEPSESSTTERMTSVSRSEPRSPRGRSRTKRPVSMSSVPETP